MAKAKEAQAWAKEQLRGIMETLYTPWTKEDEVDEEDLRNAIRRILIDFKSEGLWYCSSVSEGYFMTMSEKKKIAEIVIDEARKVKPKTILICNVYTDSAKDCVELINHSASLGSDLSVIVTPPFVYGEEGILSWFSYVAENTDIALCFQQRAPWILSPSLIARMAERWPAFCAIKNTVPDPHHSVAIMELSKGKVQAYFTRIEHYNLFAGMVHEGKLAPVINGKSIYRYQLPPELKFRDWWHTVLNGDTVEAARKFYGYHIAEMEAFFNRYGQDATGFPGVRMHNNALEKFWASQLGMPMGTGGWQKMKPGCATVPKGVQDKCRALLKDAGLIKE